MGDGRGTARERTVDVLVATPLGRGGRGGIDRLMDTVRGDVRERRIGDCHVRFGTTRGPFGLVLSPFYLAAFLARMAALKALGRLDVLHVNLSSHGSTQRKLIVCRAARALGIPYVVHLHGSRFRAYFDAARPATQAAVRAMLGEARRVIVLGRAWQEFVTERVPEARDRIVILPNASPAIERTARTERGPIRILFLGRLGARKGVPELMDALKQIADLPAWEAMIAGDGDVVETRAKIEALGLSTRVQVPGWVGPEDSIQLLATSNILVLPSRDENLPMSVIEGMSAGLAVIATPVGAVEDIVKDGETGLLVPPGDIAALADALRRLVADARLRAQVGDAGLRFHRSHLEIGGYALRLAALWAEAVG